MVIKIQRGEIDEHMECTERLGFQAMGGLLVGEGAVCLSPITPKDYQDHRVSVFAQGLRTGKSMALTLRDLQHFLASSPSVVTYRLDLSPMQKGGAQ